MFDKVYKKITSLFPLIIIPLGLILSFEVGMLLGDLFTNYRTMHISNYWARYPLTTAMHRLVWVEARYAHELKGFIDGYIFAQECTSELESELLTGKALYDSYVDEIVSTHYPDLGPEYIRAIIYHESRYDPNCRNKKTSATGLMQILPKWHTQRARNLGVMDLTDPYGNILVGCDILHEMTEKYGFAYALNYFAGGYKYANYYQSKTSPYIKALNSFIALERSGEPMDIYGGE